MKALISPQELVQVPTYVGGVLTAIQRPARVCEVAPAEFEVASPLFWVDAPENLDLQSCYYDMDSQQIVSFAWDLPEYNAIPTTTLEN